MEGLHRAGLLEVVTMPLRPEVRDAQRTLAALDAAHSRAVARLNQALARRAEVVAELDRQVAAAQAGVQEAVVAMAGEVSVELTAHVLDLDVTEVRRLVKAGSATAGSTRSTNGSAR
jgi:hypothetical protein